MAVKHGSDSWVLYGGGVEVVPLPNGRYRQTVRCKANNKATDWYYKTINSLFKAFGSSYDLPLKSDRIDSAWEPQDGEMYPDMVLVDTGYTYPPNVGEPLLEFVYETLTSSWVNEDNEQAPLTINGLKAIERPQVAKSGTALPYDEDDVGVVTIAVGGKTLYLVGVEDDSSERKGRIITRWAEKGLLSVRTPQVGGTQTVIVEALGMSSAEVDAELSEVTSNHKLVGKSVGDYEGFPTNNYTYEVDDFDVLSAEEDGFDRAEQTELSVTNFSRGTIGTDTYGTMILVGQTIDNDGIIKKKVSRWMERGVISIAPSDENFSLAKTYIYTTTGIPASSMTGLTTPTGDALPSGVTWLDPSVRNPSGFPTYTQKVLLLEISGSEVQVDSTVDHFQVTDPGVMDTGYAFNSEDESGGAVVYPEPSSMPRTYRKRATVNTYLTNTSSFSETESAYSEKSTDWCSISFYNFYNREKDGTSSVDASWRSFPNYLNSSGTTNDAEASVLGKYYAVANSVGSGSTTYAKTGVYRVGIEPYEKNISGTQLYIKTVVSF